MDGVREERGRRLSIDETSLSKGELYTIITNKDARGSKGTLVAMVRGTKAETVIEAVKHIGEDSRGVQSPCSSATVAITAFSTTMQWSYLPRPPVIASNEAI